MTTAEPQDAPRRRRQFINRPAWLTRAERRLGRAVPLHPNTLSALKLVLLTPALLWLLSQPHAAGRGWLAGALFALFALLDYLDGVVARARGLATPFGRVVDRLSDYPLLFGLAALCVHRLHPALLGVKLGLDVLLLALYLLGRGSTQNRLRTMLSYVTLFALLALSQGWLPGLFGAGTVVILLLVNIGLSSLVALYNLDILHKRHIANGLSLANLLCGLGAMHAASSKHFAVSLLLLVVGATCDGVDGAAARRWGSSRWGVYADDVADAVNFGVAPGVCLYFATGGVQGALVGGLFALFTILRLVHFTLHKAGADPGYFRGVPSPVGGVMATSAALLFDGRPLLIGLLAGMACVLMVSFGARYRHLGRLLAQRPRLLLAAPPLAVLLLGLGLWVTPLLPAAMMLGACVIYALLPVARAFARVAPTAPDAPVAG